MIKQVVRLVIISIAMYVALVTCISCGRRAIQPEDFEVFYQEFLTSEEFQLSRIDFPLEGCESDADTTIYWNTADDWAMLTGSIYDVDTTQYKVEKSCSPLKVEHRVYIEDSGFSITQTYELHEGKWYLVLYDSMLN